MSPNKSRMGEPALPVFPMQPVKSSNIAKLGWRDGELRVEFSNGGLFSYAGVDNATYRQLIAASSLGKHFGKYIRPKFKGTKL